ncbi:MAG: hypothetical protein LC635_00975 [Pseudonocardiaceae bacterium]|nr:hypothetical protein [Pseudonocardiaceae bacterium]
MEPGRAGQSVHGSPEDIRPGTTTPTAPADASSPEMPEDAYTVEDLDRCGDVAAASPRAHEFAPRSTWQPLFTNIMADGHRITAFREPGGEPGFCDVDATSATVSDPSAAPMVLATAADRAVGGEDIRALYLSPSGLLAGVVVEGVAELDFDITTVDPLTGDITRRSRPLVIRYDVFVTNVGHLVPGTRIDVTGHRTSGGTAVKGGLTYDPDKVRPVGATAKDR